MSETPKPNRKETLKIERVVSKSALIKAWYYIPCRSTYQTKLEKPENTMNAEYVETLYSPVKPATFTKAWRMEKAFTLCISTLFVGTTPVIGKIRIGKIAAQVLFLAERLKTKWNMTTKLTALFVVPADATNGA